MEGEHKQHTKYNGFLTQKNNYIWAGAMCLAWEELKDSVIKEPVQLITKDQAAIRIIENYNKSNFLKKDISEADYYSKSGFGLQTLEEINKQISTKFPQSTLPKLNLELKQTDLISFAYIFKRFDFLEQFQKRKEKKFKFRGQIVQSFHAVQQKQKKNVFYFYYQNEQNFLIGIKGKCQKDSLLILKSSVDHTIDQVIKQIIYNENKGAKRYLAGIDQFQMPIINIQASRNISQLEGLYLANQSCKDSFLSQVVQGLKIEINQKGAKMQNAAYIVRSKAKIQIKQPKIFFMDRQFWLVMKQKGKHPYLCMKIVDPQETGKQKSKK